MTDGLGGAGVLVVEDDYFIASDLARILTGAGAHVIGPFSRVEQAREALQQGERASVAVLDVNIAGSLVYPLAEELRRAGIPFVFATGYDAHTIPGQFDAVPKLVKPIEPRRMLDALARIVDRA